MLIDNRADVMFGPESGDGSMGDLDDVLEICTPPPPSLTTISLCATVSLRHG